MSSVCLVAELGTSLEGQQAQQWSEGRVVVVHGQCVAEEKSKWLFLQPREAPTVI